MKRFIPILLVVVLFASCEHEQPPRANFTVDYTHVIPGELVAFSNYSSDAHRFEWDFGDGNISTRANPTHHYSREGIYEVRLAAFNGSGVDYTYTTIEVFYTTLEVEVRDYYTDKLIPRLYVDVYGNHTDYEFFRNVLFEGVSDYDGRVVFGPVDARSYVLDVYDQVYTNELLGYDDINFIETAPLAHAEHNVFIAYVEVVPVSLKSTGEKRVRIKNYTIKSTPRTLENRKLSLK